MKNFFAKFTQQFLLMFYLNFFPLFQSAQYHFHQIAALPGYRQFYTIYIFFRAYVIPPVEDTDEWSIDAGIKNGLIEKFGLIWIPYLVYRPYFI